MNKNQNLKDLLLLADDPDESVWQSIRESLLEIGIGDIKILQNYWRNSVNPLTASRIEELINEIRFESLKTDLKAWIIEKTPSIKRGIVLYSRILDPDFTESDLDVLFQPIQKSIWIELSNKLTALEKIRIINHLLFEKQAISFKSNLEARSIHFYLPTLLKTKIGHSLTITLLFVLLARELNLALFKVSNGDLPALVYLNSPEYMTIQTNRLHEYEAMFYINLDHQIDVFGKKQFSEYITHQYPTKNQDLNIVQDSKLIEIMLLKLKLLYSEEKNTLKLLQVTQLLQLFN